MPLAAPTHAAANTNTRAKISSRRILRSRYRWRRARPTAFLPSLRVRCGSSRPRSAVEWLSPFALRALKSRRRGRIGQLPKFDIECHLPVSPWLNQDIPDFAFAVRSTLNLEQSRRTAMRRFRVASVGIDVRKETFPSALGQSVTNSTIFRDMSPEPIVLVRCFNGAESLRSCGLHYAPRLRRALEAARALAVSLGYQD